MNERKDPAFVNSLVLTWNRSVSTFYLRFFIIYPFLFNPHIYLSISSVPFFNKIIYNSFSSLFFAEKKFIMEFLNVNVTDHLK